MPSPGDPSFDRHERAARAKEAASGASEERLAELRAKHLTAVKSSPVAGERVPAEQGRAPRLARPEARPTGQLDVTGIARTAQSALGKHPLSWTSYAELCSATGLTRRNAEVVAGRLVPALIPLHWFRVRDDDGVYTPPADLAEAENPEQFGQAEADRELTTLGVEVLDGRADPQRKLHWNGAAWALTGAD
jgi:hypothetical protein